MNAWEKSMERETEKTVAEASNPDTSPQRLLELAHHPTNAVQLAVAQNANATAKVLKPLAQHPNMHIRGAVINHPNVTPKLLDTIVDIGGRFHQHIATLDNLLPETFQKLSKIDNTNLLVFLVRNKKCPENILIEQSTSPLSTIREAVANHKNTPELTITKMCRKETSFYVFHTLIAKSRKSRTNLEIIAKSIITRNDPELQQPVITYLKTFPKFKDWPEEWINAHFGFANT